MDGTGCEEWRNLIQGAFGGEDAQFAGHPNDEARALAMIAAARDAGASREIVREAIHAHLVSLGLELVYEVDRVREIDNFLDSRWGGLGALD